MTGGSTVCILPNRYVGNAHIRLEVVNLQMWNKTSLQALGKCKIKVVNPTTKQKFKVDFFIVDKELTPLLSGKAAQKMNHITVHYDKFKPLNAHKNLHLNTTMFNSSQTPLRKHLARALARRYT